MLPDVNSLPILVPFGTVTFLIIYLVGTLIADRASQRQREAAWTKERQNMREQFREDKANAVKDLKSQVEYQRGWIEDLVKELREERERKRGDT